MEILVRLDHAQSLQSDHQTISAFVAEGQIQPVKKKMISTFTSFDGWFVRILVVMIFFRFYLLFLSGKVVVAPNIAWSMMVFAVEPGVPGLPAETDHAVLHFGGWCWDNVWWALWGILPQSSKVQAQAHVCQRANAGPSTEAGKVKSKGLNQVDAFMTKCGNVWIWVCWHLFGIGIIVVGFSLFKLVL